MFKLLAKLPRELGVACSGGVDSMAVLDFLRLRHNVTVCFFHHDTETSSKALSFLSTYCYENSIPMRVDFLVDACPKGVSMEEHWRNSRYEFLHSIEGVVVTGHHLDDCVETYLFNCLHGKTHTIPMWRNNVVRPFLTTPKSVFESWCVRHEVPWVEDTSNSDLRYMRNHIRHKIVPEALKVNPGLRKVVKRLVLRQVGQNDLCE